MSCCVQPAGIGPPGAGDATAALGAMLGPIAAWLAWASLAVAGDGLGRFAALAAGAYDQVGAPAGAQEAIVAATSPPPAIAAPRRKPRRDRPLESGAANPKTVGGAVAVAGALAVGRESSRGSGSGRVVMSIPQSLPDQGDIEK